MKRIPVYLIVLFALSAAPKAINAQDYLVDFTYLGMKTKLELFFLFGQVVDYDVEMYKVRYKTPDVHGVPDTASGLMVLPKVAAGTYLPIVVYAHGTTNGPNDVPSKLLGGYQVALAYASKGFIAAAPDYLGLGDARGFHPYIHAASEASASFDMLQATVEYLETHEPEWDPNYLFLAGYSQGGHAAAALHKLLQDDWSAIYPVTAATHMSGPYSISGVMKDKILSDENYGNPAYTAYITLGLQEAYGNFYTTIQEFYKEPYASSIAQFRDGAINLDALNTALLNELSAGGNTINKRMIQDSVLDKMINDPTYVVNLALEDNDLYAWAPQAPTRLYYCTGDQQVPYQNAIVADSVMNALGANDTHAVNQGTGLDHGPCVLPSIISSINYFLTFLTPSSVQDFDKHPVAIQVSPNPATDYLMVNWEAAANGTEYQIFGMNGEAVNSGQSPSNQIDVHALPPGMYMISILVENQRRFARFIHL